MQTLGACAGRSFGGRPGSLAVPLARPVGGSWNNKLGNFRSANRNRNGTGNRNNNDSFRVARTLRRRSRPPRGDAGIARERPGTVTMSEVPASPLPAPWGRAAGMPFRTRGIVDRLRETGIRNVSRRRRPEIDIVVRGDGGPRRNVMRRQRCRRPVRPRNARLASAGSCGSRAAAAFRPARLRVGSSVTGPDGRGAACGGRSDSRGTERTAADKKRHSANASPGQPFATPIRVR